jgi:Peptidase family M1 domain/Peptidase M1 N-terminal domain
MKHLLLIAFLLSFFLTTQVNAQTTPSCREHRHCMHHRGLPNTFTTTLDTRSDSIDILFYHIDITIGNLAIHVFDSARCDIDFKPIVSSVNEMRLDLKGLTVSEVQLDGSPVAFSQVGELIQIAFPASIPMGEEHTVSVFYAGAPQHEIEWGGFYFNGQYAYNLGIGISTIPHNFGRVWFPCFDNFVERSKYEVSITAPANFPGYSNGELWADDQLTNGLRTRLWHLEEQTPTYLIGLAVGPYTSWIRNYEGLTGNIPVEVAVSPNDSSKVTGSFAHLEDALHCYEHWFGSYQWNKIGFSIVPHFGGAMEHTTCIAYPSYAIDGLLNEESLMAHEFAHQWWGNLTTTTDAPELWLKEGWASYSEHLLEEWVYGQERFKNSMRLRHLDVLQYLHIDEGGYYALSPLPDDLHYSGHTYDRGAVIVHNLRGYLGDSLFRQGATQALTNNAFSSWTSAELRDALTSATGYDLNPFFEDWVYGGGYSHFEVDSFTTQTTGTTYQTQVYVKQKLRGATQLHQETPIWFTFISSNNQRLDLQCTVGGLNSSCQFTLPFVPEIVLTNANEKLNLAHTIQEKNIAEAGSKAFDRAKCTIITDIAPADTSRVIVELHFAFPDTLDCNPYNYKMTSRYWSVGGLWPQDYDPSMFMFYDDAGEGDQLDNVMFDESTSESDVLLLFRYGPGYQWFEADDYEKNIFGSPTDGFGRLTAHHIKKGQYTIAKGTAGLTNDQDFLSHQQSLLVSPNPTTTNVLIKSEQPIQSVLIFTLDGRVIGTQTFNALEAQVLLPQEAGHYLLKVQTGVDAQVVKVVKR